MTPLFLAAAALAAGGPATNPAATPAEAGSPPPNADIVVVGNSALSIENPPANAVAVDAATIATKINAVSIEDTIKYLPSLIVRKRHIGDNFAPIATRTSGLGSSARSLIYADGALLSALIANNNGNGSPRWHLVAPEEVERIDVLYGPFSAAYAGNSIGTVVNITTRSPDHLEARAGILGNWQWHSQYATSRSLPSGQASASIGDRIGALSYFAAATHTVSNGQPLAYVTAPTAPAGTSGSIATLNRLGAPIRVLGASDIDHHVEDTFKLKLALALSPTVSASYTAGLFLDSSTADVDTYLRDAGGNKVYTSGFNSGVYRRNVRHWSHMASFDGKGGDFDWQVVGTRYAYDRDRQRSPSGALPGGFAQGPGLVQAQDGTGWVTLDAKGIWRAGHSALSFGGHVDRYTLDTQTYVSADWLAGVTGARSAASLGKTRTAALWLQDRYAIVPSLSLTLGARAEWWRAYDGFNQVGAGTVGIHQPERRARAVSPKATLEWRPLAQWTARLSWGDARRFPTVGELYQATTVGTVLANPNPDLRPERARSTELAVERRDDAGMVRLSLFAEVVTDALISQSAPISVPQPGGTVRTATVNFVQNVDRTRARGIELAVEQRGIVRGVDISGSATYADAITTADAAFPAAVGKLLPSVPHWKANAVVTWHAAPPLSLTAAVRYSSRNYATLDNADRIADTYQGFGSYLVADLRAAYQLTPQVQLALGVDNVGNRRYFLFHPFPQRSVTAELRWQL